MQFVLYFLSSAFVSIHGARILAVFSPPLISHQLAFRPLTQELAKRGHEVVVITTDPAFNANEAPTNLKEIDVHNVSYPLWQERFSFVKQNGRSDDKVNIVNSMFDLVSKIFYLQLNTESVKNVLSETNNFDLLMIEGCSVQSVALAYLFKLPVIQVSSFGGLNTNYKDMGAPTHPIVYTTPYSQRVYNLNFREKVTEFINYYLIEYIFYSRIVIENTYAREYFGPDIPSLTELINNIDMLFLNIHPIWEGNRPRPPSVVHINGFHHSQRMELSKDIKQYLDKSKNGVIYMSYGTNVKTSLLDTKKVQILVNVLSKLPYNVLWKWDDDKLPGQTGNIKISKWLPQSDILRHPNIKLFIAQGGLQSTDEGIAAGVPLLAMPMMNDQWFNAENYVYFNIGRKLDMEFLTEDSFRTAITTVIEDESYRRNIVRLRSLMRDQPQSSLERAVWWTEHVLRHRGAKHLRAPAANIDWSDVIELISVLLLSFLIITTAFCITINRLVNCIRYYLGRKLRIEGWFDSPVKIKI